MRALGTKHADDISEKTFRTRKMSSVALFVILFIAWTAPLRSVPYNFEDRRDEAEEWIERAIEVGPAEAHKETTARTGEEEARRDVVVSEAPMFEGKVLRDIVEIVRQRVVHPSLSGVREGVMLLHEFVERSGRSRVRPDEVYSPPPSFEHGDSPFPLLRTRVLAFPSVKTREPETFIDAPSPADGSTSSRSKFSWFPSRKSVVHGLDERMFRHLRS